MNHAPASLTPIKNQVLVRQDAAKDKIGSLYTPQGSEVYPAYGTVVAVGPGDVDPRTGARIPLSVKVGDRVLFKRGAATALIPDSREGGPSAWKDLLLLSEHPPLGSDRRKGLEDGVILAIVEED